MPVFAVLGNHDWQGDEAEAIAARLREAERQASVCEIDGLEVGVAGCKGFGGGFWTTELGTRSHSTIP